MVFVYNQSTGILNERPEMKTVLLIVLATATVSIIIAVIYLYYYGLFHPVTFRQQEKGPFLLVYEKHIGDYKQTGEITDRIYSTLSGDNRLETRLGFGLYYDDPRSVDTPKLRSISGCIVDETNRQDFYRLDTAFRTVEFPQTRFIVTEFPYKGQASIFMGVFRVYPRLQRYLQDHGHLHAPVMEIYDQENKKILYLVAQDMDMAFFHALLQEITLEEETY